MSTAELSTQVSLDTLQELYDQGKYLSLYEAAREAGLLERWPGVRGAVLAARTAMQLGGSRQGNAILRRLRREAPHDPEVRYFAAYWQLQRQGPYKVWRQFQTNLDLGPAAPPELRSSWFALIGETAAFFRDFETARSWLQKAEDHDPDNPWIQVCWANVFEAEDRYDEALAAARRSLAIRPLYRAGVQQTAHLLTLMNRDEEAVELLRAALEVVEGAPLAGQLCALQMELRDFAGARSALSEVVRLSPLAEKPWRKWVAAQQCELAYIDGNVEEAIAQAKIADTPFYKEIAANLEAAIAAGNNSPAVLLPVPFVRQHHVTCAPATLSAISKFWQQPAEHLEVAEEICYNGTTSHAERQWAEQHGWAVKEFTVTAESAVKVLDRGIPFTLATIEPGNAHLQAVIGYDPRRGTLQIRDPYIRSAGETTAQKFIERYRTFGPRGMAIVPAAQSALLDDLELPDTALWNLLYELDGALIKHRREEAQQIYERLHAQAPAHRLALDARRRLAIYDFNPTDQLAAVEQWLVDSPGDDRLLWEQLGLMRYQTNREQRLAQLAELCAKRESHPIFWRQYANELFIDARRHAEVEQLLGKAMRRWPTDAANYYTLASIRWDQRRWEESLELYRFAACLADKDEQYFSVYFSAAVWRRQTEPLLAMLRERYRRLGRKSMLPAKTLATALVQLSRDREALTLLEEAMALRPQDGPLMLCAADMYFAASHEHLPRSRQLLEAARELVPRLDWLRTSARLASASGDSAGALRDWQEIAKLQPLATEAHQAVVRLLAETAGQAAALEYLAETCAKYPHYYSLHVVWAEWLRDEPKEAREPVLRRMLELAPDDAWLRRELANLLADVRKFDEAWVHAEMAGKLEPFNPSYPYLQAVLYKAQNEPAKAKQALFDAIKLSVDADYAIEALMQLCTTLKERRGALCYVRDELVRQVTTGEGLLGFRQHAAGVWDGEELLAELQKAHAARPDLWHSWSVLTLQYLQLDRLDEALDIALRAAECFPLIPRLWFDLAIVHRARLDFENERAALENALRVNPGWSQGLRALCDCLARERLFAECRAFAERAVACTPLDPFNHLQLAETLWQLDEREAALDRLQRVLQIEPGLEHVWDLLQQWSEEIGQPERAQEAIRELTQRRGGEVRSWLFLNRLLNQPEQLAESLAALDKALELNPRSTDAHDQRAFTLAKAGRYREALEACQPAIFAGQIPIDLQARAAWIESQRGDLPAAIRRLRSVLSEAPQNYNYWQCLADWCQRCGDNAGYLQAAEEMAHLRPQSENSLAYLAEARLHSGDRAGAKRAFSRAFELAPAYEFAGNALFDLQLEDGELAAAAETMANMREHLNSAYIVARDVQLAVKQQDYRRALDVLQELCVLPTTNRALLEMAIKALVEQEMADAAEQVLRKSLDHPNVHEVVSRQWMDLVIQRVQRGALPDATKLYAVEPQIPQTPPFAGAWMRLGELYHDRHEHPATLRAAQALLKCAPDVAMTYGYLGEAHLDNGDKPNAIAAYERAVELDREYEFASNSLFAHYLEVRDADKMQRLIEKLETERLSSLLLMRRVQLAALRNDSTSAAQHLEALCLLPLEPQWTLRYAIIALEEAQMHAVAEEVLNRVCWNPEVQDEVALYQAKYRAKQDAYALEQELPALLAKPKSGEKALQAWFMDRIDGGRNPEVCRFISNNKSILLSNVRFWGQVLWAASRMRNYNLVYEVGQLWKKYPDAESWMLVNVIEGLRFFHHDSEAVEASKHALTLSEDNGTSLHCLWLACDAACRGDFDEALKLTKRITTDPDRFDIDYSFLHVLLESMLQLAYCEPGKRAALFARIKTKLRDTYWDYHNKGILALEPARARMFSAGRQRIRKVMGTWGAWFWYLTKKA